MIPRYAPTYTYSDLFRSLRESIQDEAIDTSLCSRLRSYFNTKHIILFGSAREALYALLKAYNRPGAVLMPAYNCIVVPEAVKFAGYSPVFIDIDYCSLSMTADVLGKSISPDVSVVLVTHLFGVPCEVRELISQLRERNILIVEDAAPALGAEYSGQIVGSFGDAAIFSFQSTKVISGEAGGALLVNNDELADKVRASLREAAILESPWRLFVKALARKMVTSRGVYSAAQFSYRTLRGEQMYEVVSPQKEMPPGFLTCCPRFASSLVFAQMDRLEWNLRRRRNIAKIYQSELSGFAGLMLPVVPEGCSPAWIQFPVMTNNKLELYKHMQRNHVDVTWTYKYSCADSYGLNGFPNAQRAAKTVLGLPTYPSLTDLDAQHICDSVKKYLENMN